MNRGLSEALDALARHGVDDPEVLSDLLEAVLVVGRGLDLDRALQRHVGFAELHAACCRHMGARGHVDAERFAADRRKGNALGTAGWVLLRFTWADLTGAPELVVRRVREVLAAAA